MQPRDFITKWSESTLSERQAAQSHFLDLCALLGEQGPAEADPSGETYAFEKGAQKTTGRSGWADVWKKGHFAWEYKGPGSNLDAAYAQLQQYAPALDNPPLLVVSDTRKIVARTNWTNTVTETHSFELADLAQPDVRQKLRWIFTDPERLRPTKTRQAVTEEVAAEFASLADALRKQGHAPFRVAHFVNQLVFCMFAEDAKLLKNNMFTKMLHAVREGEGNFKDLATELFQAMHRGGRIGFDRIAHFNGGLFSGLDEEALDLDSKQLGICIAAADRDWSEIDPSILGTLFVRGLDPDKREELGAEYTSREKILTIIKPVLTEPLLREWAIEKEAIEALINPAHEELTAAVTSANEFAELAEEVH